MIAFNGAEDKQKQNDIKNTAAVIFLHNYVSYYKLMLLNCHSDKLLRVGVLTVNLTVKNIFINFYTS